MEEKKGHDWIKLIGRALGTIATLALVAWCVTVVSPRWDFPRAFAGVFALSWLLKQIVPRPEP